ncbi:hypothetical protein HanXRQr2_Chr04g0177811 [Helianthus annuus]|uniref:Uncharacterized protein n=1 Tax=Helianthus annuus TaxID=4232 RepID=A0A9K3JA16_HELAN|nr:hypothetical protein HanXRQr2_Chr04g0177811 [Helianthus annuus]
MHIFYSNSSAALLFVILLSNRHDPFGPTGNLGVTVTISISFGMSRKPVKRIRYGY